MSSRDPQLVRGSGQPRRRDRQLRQQCLRRAVSHFIHAGVLPLFQFFFFGWIRVLLVKNMDWNEGDQTKAFFFLPPKRSQQLLLY